MQNPHLKIPTGLCSQGKAAAQAILDLLTARRTTYTGGCRAFYGPYQWKALGDYGTDSLLVLVHDGGDLASYCNPAYGDREAMTALTDTLAALGLYVEQCASWYSAVYPRTA